MRGELVEHFAVATVPSFCTWCCMPAYPCACPSSVCFVCLSACLFVCLSVCRGPNRTQLDVCVPLPLWVGVWLVGELVGGHLSFHSPDLTGRYTAGVCSHYTARLWGFVASCLCSLWWGQLARGPLARGIGAHSNTGRVEQLYQRNPKNAGGGGEGTGHCTSQSKSGTDGEGRPWPYARRAVHGVSRSNAPSEPEAGHFACSRVGLPGVTRGSAIGQQSVLRKLFLNMQNPQAASVGSFGPFPVEKGPKTCSSKTDPGPFVMLQQTLERAKCMLCNVQSVQSADCVAHSVQFSLLHQLDPNIQSSLGFTQLSLPRPPLQSWRVLGFLEHHQ